MSSRQWFDVPKQQDLEIRFNKPVEPLPPAGYPGNVHEEEIETFRATQMSILCQKCGGYIGLSRLQSHRSLHEALSLFQYNFQTKPTSEKSLNRQRNALVKGLNKTMNVSRSAFHKELAKIDLAYEILKSEMRGSLNKARTLHSSNDVEVSLKSFKTDLNHGVSLGVCQSANEKWKSVMEDAYSCEMEHISGTTCGFFAVYDGYNGQKAARKCANRLHVIQKDNLAQIDASEEFCESGDCRLLACLQQAYDEVDKLLLQGDEETSRNRWSGCSATTCLLRGGHLHVANVGNVKGILLKEDGSLQTITEDHTPSNKKERHRIKCNGDVRKLSKTVWVNGIATTTRGLGNHGDPIFKLNVISVPAVCCIPLDADDEIILLASGGFWEVFNEEEVSVLVQDWFEKKENEQDERGNGKTEEENASFENPIRIIVEGEVQVHVPTQAETKSELLSLNNNAQAGLHEENCEQHQCDDRKGHDDNNARLACGNTQDSLSNGRRQECIDYKNESVETNCLLLNEESSSSSGKPYHNITTMHDNDGIRNLSTGFLKDLAGQDGCKICLKLSKNLVRAALNAGAKDNITVMVVLLNINEE